MDPSISRDGRWILFVSEAENLVSNDANGPLLDVFVHDRNAGTSRLISLDSTRSGSANGPSHSPAISPDGRWIAFASEATNLTADEDLNGASDIFLVELETQETRLVSRALGSNSAANRGSYRPILGPTGNWIFFDSDADNLVDNDRNLRRDVFAYRVETAAVELVSVNEATQTSPAETTSYRVLPGSSESHVVFRGFEASNKSSLSPSAPPANGRSDLFVRDMTNRATFQIIAPSGNPSLDYYFSAFAPTIAAQAPVVVFIQPSDPFGRVRTPRAVAFNLATQRIDMTPLVPETLDFAPNFRFEPAAVAATGGRVALERVVETSGDIQRTVAVWLPAREHFFALDMKSSSPVGPVISPQGTYAGYQDRDSGLFYLHNAATGAHLTTLQIGGFPLLSFSDDESFLVFQMDERPLVPSDRNGSQDIYLFDLTTPLTGFPEYQLISHVPEELTSSTSLNFSRYSTADISFDGSRILLSASEPLANEDKDDEVDAYLVGAEDRTPILASELESTEAVQYGAARPIQISRDGTKALYTQEWSDTLLEDFVDYYDVYVFDLNSGVSQKASDGLGVFELGHENRRPKMSGDGRHVVFESKQPGSQISNVYWRDMESNELVKLSALPVESDFNLPELLDNAGHPCISDNGRRVIFFSNRSATSVIRWRQGDSFVTEDRIGFFNELPESAAVDSNGTYAFYSAPFDLFSSLNLYRFQERETVELQRKILPPNTSLSLISADSLRVTPDGRFAVLEAGPRLLDDVDTSIRPLQIVWIDLESEELEIITRNPTTGEIGDANSTHPDLSDDGRFVAFRSRADNLGFEPFHSGNNLYLFDRSDSSLHLLSSEANQSALAPFISGDGSSIVFSSLASNLVQNDFNRGKDLFFMATREIPSEDSDEDGLDDSWERNWFGGLDADGHEDADGDGATNRHEYYSGTNPLDPESLFDGEILRSNFEGEVTLRWRSIPGSRYQVEYKNRLSENAWRSLSSPIRSEGAVMEFTDETINDSEVRVYRIRLVR